MSLDIQPVLIFADGTPVSSLNPLPTTGGGGGGTVDQGAANGDAAKGWSARLTDGAAFVVPAKTGQLPAALGATTAAGSVSVGIATDQLSTLATAANQTTANSSLVSILGQLDNKTSTLATEATVSASKTLLGAGLPAALVGGKLDVNLGTSSITLPVSGPLTDAQLRATSVPVSQGAGSGAAATFWYTRVTDGTNTQPTMDTAARSGFQRITDGTNTAAVKAASTAAVATDPAVVVAVSPNNNISIVGTGSPGTAAGGVLSVQGVSGGSNLNVSQATASALNATVVQATASSLNATVVGGAANAAAVSGNPVLVAGYDGTNARTIRTDSSGSIYAAGGSSYNTNAVNETRTVRTGAGVLIRLVINPGTSSTFVCYDNTAGSGTVLCALTTGSSGGGNGYSVEVGATFSTGLTYVSTGGCNVTLVYRAF